MEQNSKKVSVEIALKYDNTKVSRIMEITTNEAGVKKLQEWINLESKVLNIDGERFKVDSLKVEQTPSHGYFAWDFNTRTTTWHDVHGKPISDDTTRKNETPRTFGCISVEVNPLPCKPEAGSWLDNLKGKLKKSLEDSYIFPKQNTVREKVGFYVNQKQVDDLRTLHEIVCLHGGDVKRRISTSAYQMKSATKWKLEKRQWTPGSMTLKQVYDLLYKYIGQ